MVYLINVYRRGGISMQIQPILENLLTYVILAMVIGLVSKALNDGLIDAWGIDISWIKRVLVFITNAFLVYAVGFEGLKDPKALYVFLLLLVCAGAEACHSLINKLNDLKAEDDTDEEVEDQDEAETYEEVEEDIPDEQ